MYLNKYEINAYTLSKFINYFVQRGVQTLAAGTANATITLDTPVKVGQSWVLASCRSNSTASVHRTFPRVYLQTIVNGYYTELYIIRNVSSTAYTIVEWQVITGTEFSVQSGIVTTGTSETTVNINEVDRTKAFALNIGHHYATAADGFIRIRFTSDTQIAIKNNNNVGSRDQAWQVVEWKGATVQYVQIANAVATNTTDITTIDPDKTFIIASWSSTSANQPARIFSRHRIYLDGTQWKVEARKGTSTGTTTLDCFVVSHPHITVQSYLETISGASVAKTITEVDPEKAVAMVSNQGNAYQNEDVADTMHRGTNSHQLTNGTTATVTRVGTSGTLYANIQVVSFL